MPLLFSQKAAPRMLLSARLLDGIQNISPHSLSHPVGNDTDTQCVVFFDRSPECEGESKY